MSIAAKIKESIAHSKQQQRFCGKLKASYCFRKTTRLFSNLFYQKHLKEVAHLKVAVHIHLFYLDLLEEFITNLKNIPVNFVHKTNYRTYVCAF